MDNRPTKHCVIVARTTHGLWTQEQEIVGVYEDETANDIWLKQGDLLVPVSKTGLRIRILS